MKMFRWTEKCDIEWQILVLFDRNTSFNIKVIEHNGMNHNKKQRWWNYVPTAGSRSSELLRFPFTSPFCFGFFIFTSTKHTSHAAAIKSVSNLSTQCPPQWRHLSHCAAGFSVFQCPSFGLSAKCHGFSLFAIILNFVATNILLYRWQKIIMAGWRIPLA